ncbi:hypothetical protein DMP23_47415 [Amycolatopsis sp. A1MSW2902]|uniref:hypothetical protein n=1 Tax=Amycolatopsis sp. A1MSW2902 TaxID=687413 RepID=UPI00307DCB62
MGKQEQQRDEIAGAVGKLFPADAARAVVKAEAFGALVYRVGQRMDLYGISAADVLGEVDEGDREFAGQADVPAAFLARKVADLPSRAEGTAAVPQTAVTSGNVRSGLADVVGAAMAFSDAVARVGAESFGDQASVLERAELAWVIDRLDDTRGAVAECLGELATSVAASVEADGDGFDFEATVERLQAVGDGLYASMQEIDPDGKRHDVDGLPRATAS